MSSGLLVNDLRFAFGQTEILRGVTLSVPPGSICAVIGSSGSGKTTIIKSLLLLEQARSGRVDFGERVLEFPLKSGAVDVLELRKGFGYVPQSSLLLPHLTAMQNVMLPLVHAQGVDERSAADRASAALAAVGLGEFAARPPWRLSGGQQQRVAIARALAVRPQWYFLDEPTAALDGATSHQIGAVLRRDVTERGAAAIVVTHNLGFARRACDSIALLVDGAIRWQRPTAEVEIDQVLDQLA
jgi:polar amino acid transport system ATP-binding protein